MKCGVLGASGFIGLQLVEILGNHPNITGIVPFSRKLAGRPLAAINPIYKGHSNVQFCKPDKENLANLDALFIALPHGEAAPYVKIAMQHDIPVVDLSADFRMASKEVYEDVFGEPHPEPDMLSHFEQVCPDINGPKAKDKNLVSVPGCTATAAILALYPLLADDLISSRRIIVDAKVSSSGAGISAGMAQSHVFRNNGVRVYRMLREHRHVAEVESFLGAQTGKSIEMQLSVSSVDMVRGISAIAYFEVADGADTKEIGRSYRKHYGEKTFVRVIRQNSGMERYPNPQFLRGTNYCDIGFECDPKRKSATSITALDNLVRGGAGQAVQAFNYQHSLAPDLGLSKQITFP